MYIYTHTLVKFQGKGGKVEVVEVKITPTPIPIPGSCWESSYLVKRPPRLLFLFLVPAGKVVIFVKRPPTE